MPLGDKIMHEVEQAVRLSRETYYKSVFPLLYLRTNGDAVNIHGETEGVRKLDIVAIAFNNGDLVRHQIRLLRKNLLDEYCYAVADNSTDLEKQKEIFDVCMEYGVHYIRLGKLPAYYSGSLSHGMALNWIYKNYIRLRKPQFFGFVDHDIFPVRPHSIVKHLVKSPVYGHIQERHVGGGPKWYLWAGFCFFDYGYVRDKKLDFMPALGLDTGGRNWRTVFSHLNKDEIDIPKHEYAKFAPEGRVSPSRGFYEYVDDWVHTFDGSGWKEPGATAEVRQKLVDQLLAKYY